VRGLAFLVLLLTLTSFLAGAEAQQPAPDVIRVTIDGVVSQGTFLHVERGLERAEQLDVPLLIQLDTPGGLVGATLDLDDLLARAKVPILTYVGPGGGTFAFSAGTFILLMGQVSGMADGSTIGSAQPVDGEGNYASDKVTNALVGRIEAIAERNGRNPELAAKFITENLNMNATAALNASLIDHIDDDAHAFLASIHGRNVNVTGTLVSLDTAGGRIEDVTPGALARVVDFIGNPQITIVLILAGTYGVVFGIANAGTYVPEVLGALLLILGFIGLGLFATSTAGIILLILALLFFVVEIFTPTHGILVGAGVVAIIFAAIFLLKEPLLPQGVKNWFVGTTIALAVTTGALVIAAITLALRTAQNPNHDVLMGARGIVMDTLSPVGRIEVHGQIWAAEIDMGRAEIGAEVLIFGREGLRLHVSTLDELATEEE
jgi:membrane-bound serine protease (ClpP class)